MSNHKNQNDRQGLILLDRGVLDHPLFKEEPYTEREAWIWMITEASWTARSVRGKSGPIHLNRGQFSCSIRFMAEKFNWSKSRVDRFINKLILNNMVEKDNETTQNVTTICNYETYQNFDLYSGTRNGTTSEPISGTTERYMNAAGNNAHQHLHEICAGQDTGQPRDDSGTNKNTLNTLNTSIDDDYAAYENSQLLDTIAGVINPIANDRLRNAFIQGDFSQLSIVSEWRAAGAHPDQIIKTITKVSKIVSERGDVISSLKYFNDAVVRERNGKTFMPSQKAIRYSTEDVYLETEAYAQSLDAEGYYDEKIK